MIAFPKLSQYSLVTKIYITKWCDGLVWINPAIQQNCFDHDLYPQTKNIIPIIFGSIERIVHIEPEPFTMKADLLLGMRFLAETTYSLSNKY